MLNRPVDFYRVKDEAHRERLFTAFRELLKPFYSIEHINFIYAGWILSDIRSANLREAKRWAINLGIPEETIDHIITLLK